MYVGEEPILPVPDEPSLAEACAVVERALREFSPLVDVQVRHDHVSLLSRETVRANTLLDAIEALRDKTSRVFPPKDLP